MRAEHRVLPHRRPPRPADGHALVAEGVGDATTAVTHGDHRSGYNPAVLPTEGDVRTLPT